MAGPIHVLELRSVRGTGGGPEKTILLGATRIDPARVRVTVAYLRDNRDPVFGIDTWARGLGIDYTDIRERHSFDPGIWPPLCALVRERGIQIVHGHEYKTNLLALLLARTTGVSPLSTAHGWVGHSWRERHVYYPADKWFARHFPRVLAVSENIRQELIRAGSRPDRVMTLLNGIDTSAFTRDRSRFFPVRAALGVPADAILIGAVGRAEPQKRFDLLIEAFSDLHKRHPRARLVLVGAGSLSDAIARLVAEKGLENLCVLTGHREDVADLHNAFDLFVQSSDYEGTPNAVLEAMALETPIVATDAGGTRHLIDDGVHGRLVGCRDVGALVEAMEETLSSPSTARERVNAARRRVAGELSFDARLEALTRVYEALAGGLEQEPPRNRPAAGAP